VAWIECTAYPHLSGSPSARELVGVVHAVDGWSWRGRRSVPLGLPVVNIELSTIQGVYAGHRHTKSLAYRSRSTTVEPC
jgi:hypothetical protein